MINRLLFILPSSCRNGAMRKPPKKAKVSY